MATPRVEFKRISRVFPGVRALREVSFSVRGGECHALLGENGAGKSTLGKILAGVLRPDSGRLLLDGRPVAFRNPLDAAAAGVRIVHQELAFCPNLTIAENLYLGRLPARAGFVQWRAARAGARQMLARVGLGLDPDTPMSQLSTGQEQLVQIAVAIGAAARVIVMDEPTSSLSQADVQRLYTILDELRAAGVTILYVSHRLEEIRRLCDRVTVLRDGRYVDTVAVADTGAEQLVRLMIGRDLPAAAGPRQATAGTALLRVTGLSAAGRFDDVSFEVRAGEVVGLAGLVGAGRSEVARAVFGIDRYQSGGVWVGQQRLAARGPRAAIALGLGLLPEDRKRQGLVLSLTCRHNLSLTLLDRLARWGFVRGRAERALAQSAFAQLAVRAPHVDAGIGGLSGGNQQKIVLAKWLARNCRVLILDEPTRGVDVGAKAEIHALIEQLAAEGRAILLISSELPELLRLSTRVLVLRGGRIIGELPRAQASEERIMRLMAGLGAAARPA